MRGVVSLAAALSIPIFIQGEQSFPYRNLILFITFIVILVTLVFQGLTLPWVIRKVNLQDRFRLIPAEKQELIIQKKIAQISLKYLNKKYDGNLPDNDHLNNLHQRLNIDMKHLNHELDSADLKIESTRKNYQDIYLELLEHQRKLLKDMNRKAEFDDELIRKYLSLIDLEEYKIREKQTQE